MGHCASKRGQGGQDCTRAPPPKSWCWPSPPRHRAVPASHRQPSPDQGAAGGLPVGATGMRQHRDAFHSAPAANWCDPACRTPCPALMGFRRHQPTPFLKRGARFRKGAQVVCLLGMGLLCVGSPTSPSLEHSILASVPRPRDTTAGRIFLATAESRITSYPGWQLSGSLTDAASPLPRVPPPQLTSQWGAGGDRETGTVSAQSLSCKVQRRPPRFSTPASCLGGFRTGTSGLCAEMRAQK